MAARILLVAEAVTLAHVGRMISLGKLLLDAGYEVSMATDPRYNTIVGHLPFAVHPLQTISSKQFFDALDKGTPIYSKEQLLLYVEDDTRLLSEVKPDVVVGDFRISLMVSARRANIPFINVTNAYWSPYAQISFPVPDIPAARLLGPRLGQLAFNLARPIAFGLHVKAFNQLLKHFNMLTLPFDMRHAYTAGDYTLYSDLPSLVPVKDLPSTHRFIGPVQWSPQVPLPHWWNEVVQSGHAIVYINLGSSGKGQLLPGVLRDLKEHDTVAIAATAARVSVTDQGTNEYVTDFLPGDAACDIASAVICNGGSPSCYQALASGKPILGIPTNLDQYLNMSLVERAGAGKLLRPQLVANKTRFKQAIDGVLAGPIRAAAERLAAETLAFQGHPVFLDTIKEALGTTATR